MKRKINGLLPLLLAAIILLSALPVSAHAEEAGSFSDVPSDAWYYNDVMKLSGYRVINGYPDGSFRPDKNLSRGEFIHMVAMVAEIWSATAPKGIHWAENDWNALKDAGILDVSFYSGVDANGYVKEYIEPLFPCTAKALDAAISRNEMAYIINGVLYSTFYEKQMELKDSSDSYANYISDYDTMSGSFKAPVEQVFSKGIITGYSDGSFQGINALSRAESAAIILRMASSANRKVQSFAVEKKEAVVTPGTSLLSSPSQSFAFKYRTMTNAQRRQALFGDANKTYFTSAADAGNHITKITVKTWDINSSGQKYTRSWALQVNVLVAEEVKGIFDYIYNSPEKFPIHSMGGARYSDTMRHSWGCAIDINPNENYYIHYASGQTVGKFCYKNGSSPYCITPGGSVVKAFALYGWGWGGQGWTSAADYMHFSILSSGG